MNTGLLEGADLAGLPFATYGRQSDRREDGSVASPKAQKERGVATGEGRGMVHVAHYEDIGLSGWAPNVVRPDFERMIRDAEAGKFKVLVVLALSRLTRKGVRDALEIHDRLKAAGVILISVNEPFLDTSSPIGVALFALVAALAQQESFNKSTFITGAKEHLKKAGGFVGGHTGYGLTTEWVTEGEGENALTLRKIKPVPEEAKVLRPVADNILGKDHKGGTSLRAECERLNREQVPTRNPRKAKDGTAWHPGGLRRILRDPRLAGYAAIPIGTKKDGQTRVTYRYKIVRDAAGKPVTSHEAIIPPDDWWALQRVLDERARHAGGAGTKKLLSGIDLFKCECGWSMSSGGPERYQCKRPRGTLGNHSSNVIQESLADEYVGRALMARLSSLDETDPEDLGLLAAATQRWADTVGQPQTARERAELKAEQDALDDAERELYEARRAGVYAGRVGTEEFIKDKAAIDDARSAVESQLAALAASDSPALPLSAWTEHDGDPVGPGSWWASATNEDRQAVLKLFVERITVRPRPENATGRPMGGKYDPAQRLDITWRTPDGDGAELFAAEA